MAENTKRRIDFIDLTKGLCIILVVLGHVGGAFDLLDYRSCLSCFRMPLYFFVSGLFFKSYEGPISYLIQKINKLLIPFTVFYVGSFLIMYTASKLAPGLFRLPVRFSELLLVFQGHELIRFNPPIWFLVALFNCNILFYLVHYLRNRSIPLFFVATIVIGVTGFWLGQHQITLPFYLDVAMTALPFYVGGFWIRRYNFFLFPHHRFDKFIPLFILIAAIVVYFTAIPIGMRTNNYYSANLFQVYISSFAGIFTIMLLCKRIKKISIISYLGRYSIITMSLHGPLLHFLRPTVARFVTNEWAYAIILFISVLALCLALTPLMVKYMPKLVAQKDLLPQSANSRIK